MALASRHLLGLCGVSAEEIKEILDTAELMKTILNTTKKTPHLQGRSIVTLFYENSTRTRMSFELAAKYMSGAASNISASASSVQKGENAHSTGPYDRPHGTDIIIIRHPMSGAPHLLSKHFKEAVINAGDGMHEHPTQALLDMYTMREKKGTLEGLNVAIIGDTLHSRVVRSNIIGLTTMGAHVTIAGPATLLPPEIERFGIRVTTDIRSAVKDADVVMGLRIQRERQKSGLIPSVREYAKFYGINEEVMALAKPGALVMHPGPMNRGVEISSETADSDMSVIDEQVTNGLAVRMALLFMLSRR
jgi:aspartate carbamoyltransferase catalytic subunit